MAGTTPLGLPHRLFLLGEGMYNEAHQILPAPDRSRMGRRSDARVAVNW